MGISVILGIVVGKYLDAKLDTTPYFFWLGFAIGVAAAAKSIVMIAKKAKKELSDDDSSAPKKN